MVDSRQPRIATLPALASTAKTRLRTAMALDKAEANAVLTWPSFIKVEPTMTRFAPRSRTFFADSIERIPPPTWHGSRRVKISRSPPLSPVPMAASRSISCTKGKLEKRSIHSSKLSNSRAFLRP